MGRGWKVLKFGATWLSKAAVIIQCLALLNPDDCEGLLKAFERLKHQRKFLGKDGAQIEQYFPFRDA